MLKKIMLVLVAIVIFLSLSLPFSQSAQKYAQEEMALSDFSERFSKIEAKLDVISKNIDATNKEIARKLDHVLSNQEKIFSELSIIKVRASKR